jgi:hypothetical protein
MTVEMWMSDSLGFVPANSNPKPCDALHESEDCPIRDARGYGFPYIPGGPLTIGYMDDIRSIVVERLFVARARTGAPPNCAKNRDSFMEQAELGELGRVSLPAGTALTTLRSARPLKTPLQSAISDTTTSHHRVRT